MPNDNRRPDPAIVEQFFVQHLPYEINMLRWLYPELSSGKNSQPIHNALVEAFHLHARNITEFFTLNSNCSFYPRWFTDDFEVNKKFIDEDLIKKINQQMSHLTSKRVVGIGQLASDDWEKIKNSIDAEVSRFEGALTSEYSGRWRLDTFPLINVGIGTGASSQFSTLTPQTHTTNIGPQLVIVGHHDAEPS